MATLFVELVPKTSWGDNLRSRFKPSEWDRLRFACYAAAGHKCEICGGVGRRHPVECHEIWHYDDEAHVQTLHGLIALCPSCHEVKHFGRTQVTGRRAAALAHLARVNGWTKIQASEHVASAFAVWRERSKYPWTLDISKVEAPAPDVFPSEGDLFLP